MATNVQKWLSGNPTSDPAGANRRILLVGDFNSYLGEDPIQSFLSGGAYVSLIDRLIGPTAYSFNFGSQSGYLDHALVNGSFLPFIKGDCGVACERRRTRGARGPRQQPQELRRPRRRTSRRTSSPRPITTHSSWRSIRSPAISTTMERSTCAIAMSSSGAMENQPRRWTAGWTTTATARLLPTTIGSGSTCIARSFNRAGTPQRLMRLASARHARTDDSQWVALKSCSMMASASSLRVASQVAVIARL